MNDQHAGRVSTSVLRHLAQRIREIEANARPHQTTIPLGVPGLDKILPHGRLPAGALVELLQTTHGAGVWTVALILARQACGEDKVLLVADSQRCVYPPAAAKLGIDLERTIVVRPKAPTGALIATAQGLRCAAIGAVASWFDKLTALDFRRLQLAAEAGGGVGVLLRPIAALRVPSFATVRLLVSPGPSLDHRRRVRLEVVRFRGGKSGQAVTLEIDDETGSVRVSAPLAPATAVARTARSSG